MKQSVYTAGTERYFWPLEGKSNESVQCAMTKACDACADMGQLQHTLPIRKTFPLESHHFVPRPPGIPV